MSTKTTIAKISDTLIEIRDGGSLGGGGEGTDTSALAKETTLAAIRSAVEAPLEVTGTFWQTTQPVSGTVGISGTVGVTGTFFQSTQPVSLASSPLPTGAATEETLSSGVGLRPDCTGVEESLIATLSATPWTALNPRLAVPDWATRAAITPQSGRTRYRLNGDPGGAPTSTATAGGTLELGVTRMVGLAAGTSRTLGFTSAIASATVLVEWLP